MTDIQNRSTDAIDHARHTPMAAPDAALRDEGMQPDPDVLAQVASEAAARGPLPFSRFMDIALYGPAGYYTRHARIGAAGDFVTAAAVPAFADTMARWVDRQWRALGQPEVLQVVEIGAGEGTLAAELTSRLAAWRQGQGGRPEIRFVILETSEMLAHRQRDKLAGAPLPVTWGAPDAALDTTLIANEVLDALPVERVRRMPDGRWEWALVAVGEAGMELSWDVAPPEIAELCETWLPIPPGTTAELCPVYPSWFESARAWGRRIRAVWLDYGITRAEWESGVRPEGTLRGFLRHTLVHPVLAAGRCDITADVHWDWAMAAAEAVGWRVLGLRSQGAFLIAHGILESLVQPGLPDTERVTRTAAVKTLILPGGMGERFSALELAWDGGA